MSDDVTPAPDSSGVDPTSIDVLSAALRADASDTETFFAVLAGKLADSLGDAVTLVRGGGRFRKDPKVRRVEVRLGEQTYEAERDGARVVCRVRRTVRGVVLKTEEVDLDRWLQALAEGLSAEAARSSAARAALEGLLG